MEDDLAVLRGVCCSESSTKKRCNVVAKLGLSGDIKSSCCQCKDLPKTHNRGMRCKHVHAAAMHYERSNSPRSRFTEGIVCKVCQKQIYARNILQSLSETLLIPCMEMQFSGFTIGGVLGVSA